MTPGSEIPSPIPSAEFPTGRGPGTFAEPALDEEAGGVDIRRYLSVLLRYKWMIAGLGVLGLAAGFGLSRVVRPTYEAQATIQIDIISRNAIQTSPIRSSQLLESRSWIDLMRSFLVLDEVVRRRRLFVEPVTPEQAPLFNDFEVSNPFTPGVYRLTVDDAGARSTLVAELEGRTVEQVALGDSVGRSLGFRWAPRGLVAGQSVAFTVRTPRDAAVRLSERLDIPPMQADASFMRIALRGTDPVGITATVNQLAERFVEVATFLKKDKLSQVTQVLQAQLESSAADLRNAENALETFKVNTITLPSDRGGAAMASGLTETRDPVRAAFFRLRLDRDSLALERDAIVRALRTQSDTNVSLVVTLGAIPSVAASSDLASALARLSDRRSLARQMRLAFGPNHPPLQEIDREVVELERSIVPQQARAVIANLEQRIGDFDQRIGAQSREMQQIPQRVSEEARRERNVQIADNLYVQLQAAFEQAKLSELSASPDVRVLDAADVPTQPLTDQILIVIGGGLAGGLGLGILLALLLDRFDRRIRYPDQVTKGLRLPIVGALPLVRRDRQGKANADDSTALLEALRGVRQNLSWGHGAAGTFVTTITSPGPGDGKSFLASNLAMSFASAGKRTLLIDADTRRGLLHHTLDISRKPGLLDFLSGSASLDQVIRKVPKWDIDFLPCGTRRAGGPELLASPAMAQLVLGLRASYEVIILDSPPLGAGIDPLVIASLSGSLVLVLRSGVTDRQLAEARLHDLDRLPIRILGAVLNDVKPEGLYRYYSYLPGYRAEEEEADEDKVRTPAKRKLIGGA